MRRAAMGHVWLGASRGRVGRASHAEAYLAWGRLHLVGLESRGDCEAGAHSSSESGQLMAEPIRDSRGLSFR